eukprot:2469225-Rhodomonas_salina.2
MKAQTEMGSETALAAAVRGVLNGQPPMSLRRAATQAAIRRQLDHICFVFKDPLQYVQKQRAKAGGKSASKGDAPGTEPYDPYLCDFSGGDVIGHLLRFVEGRLGDCLLYTSDAADDM